MSVPENIIIIQNVKIFIFIYRYLYYNYIYSAIDRLKKCTFGVGDRFDNANSYLRNNPQLTGNSKTYVQFNTNNKGNKNKSVSPFGKIDTKRTLIPSLSSNEIEEKQKIRRQRNHKLSNKNNKSSSCFTPNSFNPLINYRNDENKNNFKKKVNKLCFLDHFQNMIPTQEIKYKPLVKRPLYDYNRESGYYYAPGKYKNDVNANIPINKKKIENDLFRQRYENYKISENEESKQNTSSYSQYINNNKSKNKNKKCIVYRNKGNQLYKGKKGKVCTYYFDNPIISCCSMKKGLQINRSCDTTTSNC